MKSRRNSILLASVIITLIMTAGLRANMVYNGDFENGIAGIVTNYIYNGSHSPYSPNWVKEQEYTVYTNPNLVHQYWVSYGDHTSGTGNMMIVNAATVADQTVWEQAVTVLPNRDYIFTYWLSSSYSTNLAQLECSFNGSTVGTVTAPGTTGVWQEVSYNWNSGASSSAIIRLVDLTRISGGDDFAIDDISLVVPEPGTLLLLGLGGLFLRRRSGQVLRKRK